MLSKIEHFYNKKNYSRRIFLLSSMYLGLSFFFLNKKKLYAKKNNLDAEWLLSLNDY